MGSRAPALGLEPKQTRQPHANNATITRDLRQHLRETAHRPAAKSCLTERCQWTDEQFECIDWDAFSSACNKHAKRNLQFRSKYQNAVSKKNNFDQKIKFGSKCKIEENQKKFQTV